MTLIINSESYTLLLAKYQPKVIETEEENDRVISLAEELEHKADRTKEEDAILELLITLIEKFENEQYLIPESTPHSMLLHLMEANEIDRERLVDVIGSRKVVSEIIDGKHSISRTQAKALANFFSVDLELFI
jgi:HTH-type transcriptional regulator/antitoxin HigA